MTSLFKIPIPTTGGSFECTQPAERVYLLSFESPPDNRLTTTFLKVFLEALDKIENEYPNGVLITTSKIAKFYSNGLDLEHVGNTPGFRQNSLYPLFIRLLTYPMPTVALINGHAFAGGLMVAMHHDYRVQNPSKGFLCLNEILFGVVLGQPMMRIFRHRGLPGSTYRDLVLEGKRFGAKDSVEARLVDFAGGLDETLAFIKARDLIKKGEFGIYGDMKKQMYPDVLSALEDFRDDPVSTKL